MNAMYKCLFHRVCLSVPISNARIVARLCTSIVFILKSLKPAFIIFWFGNSNYIFTGLANKTLLNKLTICITVYSMYSVLHSPSV